MLQFGPYGPNHATAATFAFKRELLKDTKFDEESSVAEERKFLKEYTVPFVQLESIKSILVFSHNHNSFDKKELLQQLPNPHVHETPLFPKDLVSQPDILKFFMEDIDSLLDNYLPGKPDNKPDVKRQLAEIKISRENKIQELVKQQSDYQALMTKITVMNNPETIQKQLNDQTTIIQELIFENNHLKEQVSYLNNKITELIKAHVEKRKEEKKIELSNNEPTINII